MSQAILQLPRKMTAWSFQFLLNRLSHKDFAQWLSPFPRS